MTVVMTNLRFKFDNQKINKNNEEIQIHPVLVKMSEPSSKDTVLKTAMVYVCGGTLKINEKWLLANPGRFWWAREVQKKSLIPRASRNI